MRVKEASRGRMYILFCFSLLIGSAGVLADDLDAILQDIDADEIEQSFSREENWDFFGGDQTANSPALPAPLLAPESVRTERPTFFSGPYSDPEEPSELFRRVPLRPPMSDGNWRRWAGTSINKSYRVREHDTLWGISQRLFGTPHLWPKIWELNAQFGNPHVVAAGTELRFHPGNPFSASTLAFSPHSNRRNEPMPSLRGQQQASLLERLDFALKEQAVGRSPPFRYFLMGEKPEPVAKVPERKTGNRFFIPGEGFSVSLPDGHYSVVRIHGEMTYDFQSAYRLLWLGTIRVSERRAELLNSFAEVKSGDMILDQSFALSPLAIHSEVYEITESPDWARFMPLQEGSELMGSANTLVGLRFPNTERGPRAGALIRLEEEGQHKATLLLVNRRHRLGTAWLLESSKELTLGSWEL